VDKRWVKTALEVTKRVKACHPKAKLYLVPASPVRSGKAPWPPELCQTYLSVIHHPECFGEIEQRLKAGFYSAPDDWISAMRRVTRNAFVYNSPNDTVGKDVLDGAEAASRLFEAEMLRLRGIRVV